MTDIVRSEDVVGGKPLLEGERIGVLDVLAELDGVRSPEAVAEELRISPEQVEAAVEYAETHPEVVDELRQEAERTEEKLSGRDRRPSARPMRIFFDRNGPSRYIDAVESRPWSEVYVHDDLFGQATPDEDSPY